MMARYDAGLITSDPDDAAHHFPSVFTSGTQSTPVIKYEALPETGLCCLDIEKFCTHIFVSNSICDKIIVLGREKLDNERCIDLHF